MALLPPHVLDCVCAIGIDDGPKIRYFGTGFIYGYRDETMLEGRYTTAVVTNRHVVEDYDHVILALNVKDESQGRPYAFALKDDDGKNLWAAHPSGADIAALPLDFDYAQEQGLAAEVFCSDTATASLAECKDLGVAEGDTVFVLGFPLGLIGRNKSYPIVRHGVISRIRDAIDGHEKDFLIDASVFPGNSGGPVFLAPSLMAVGGTKAVDTGVLIGMVQSYIPYRDTAISVQTKQPRVTFEENSGLASVIPVDYIHETIRMACEKFDQDTEKIE